MMLYSVEHQTVNSFGKQDWHCGMNQTSCWVAYCNTYEISKNILVDINSMMVDSTKDYVATHLLN